MIEINGKKIEPIRVIDPEITFTDDCGLTDEEKEQFKKEFHNRLWYYKVYLALIEHCKEMEKIGYPEGTYTEKHHILPKCMGGTNDKSNLVRMPAREHIMAHILLMFIFPNYYKLAFAACVTLYGNKNSKSSREIAVNKFSTKLVAKVKEEANKSRKLEGVSKKVLEFNKTRLGIPLSEEHKKRVSESLKGRVFSKEHRKHLSEANTGTHLTEESKEKISNTHKGIPLTTETKRKIRETIEKNGNSLNKRVIGPDGFIYDNAKECAKLVGIHYGTLIRYINHKPEKGYRYYKED